MCEKSRKKCYIRVPQWLVYHRATVKKMVRREVETKRKEILVLFFIKLLSLFFPLLSRHQISLSSHFPFLWRDNILYILQQACSHFLSFFLSWLLLLLSSKSISREKEREMTKQFLFSFFRKKNFFLSLSFRPRITSYPADVVCVEKEGKKLNVFSGKRKERKKVKEKERKKEEREKVKERERGKRKKEKKRNLRLQSIFFARRPASFGPKKQRRQH